MKGHLEVLKKKMKLPKVSQAEWCKDDKQESLFFFVYKQSKLVPMSQCNFLKERQQKLLTSNFVFSPVFFPSAGVNRKCVQFTR